MLREEEKLKEEEEEKARQEAAGKKGGKAPPKKDPKKQQKEMEDRRVQLMAEVGLRSVQLFQSPFETKWLYNLTLEVTNCFFLLYYIFTQL